MNFCFSPCVRIFRISIGLLVLAAAISSCKGNTPRDSASYAHIHPIIYEGKWAFLHDKGHFLTEKLYSSASVSSEGLARVRSLSKEDTSRRWGFCNTEGKLVIPFNFELARDFHDSMAAVSQGQKWGYIDRRGKLKINFQYDYAWDFHRGYAPVLVGNKIFYINKNGKKIMNQFFGYARPFREGLRPTRSQKNAKRNAIEKPSAKMGYIDLKGRWKIPARFEAVWPFSNARALVRYHGKYGFIDRRAKMVIPASYDDAWPFAEGLAAVKKGEEIAFVDINGKIVLPFAKRVIRHYRFQSGLLGVAKELQMSKPKQKGKKNRNLHKSRQYRWGFIDKSGKWIIPAKFRKVWPFQGDMAPVQIVAGGWGYTDKKGNVAWQSKK